MDDEGRLIATSSDSLDDGVGLYCDLSILKGLPNELPAARWKRARYVTRSILTFPVYVVFFLLGAILFTLPILLLGTIYWCLSALVQSIMAYCCCCCRTQTAMGRTVDGVYKITATSEREALDFLLQRTYGYIWNIAWSYALAFGRFFSCRVRTHVIPDEVLARFTVGSLFSHALVETTDGFYMDTRSLQRVKLFEGCSFEVVNVSLARDGHVTEIAMVDGSKHHPGDDTWDLAKLHFQGCFNTLTTCFEHSWVHFVFPDAAVVAMNMIDQKSLLYKLLFPHLRFVAAINRIRTKSVSSLPINNTESCFSGLLTYLHLPYTFENFNAANSEHCNRYYFPDDYESHHCDLENLQHLSNFRLPPYDKDYKPLTPYHTFLFSYFLVIQSFVRRFRLDLDADRKTYEKWIAKVGEFLPAALYADPVDVISTLIWQCSIVHSTDHVSLNLFRSFLCGYNTRKWNPADKNKTSSFFRRYDLVRTLGFMDNFDMPWYNPFNKLLLMDVDHKFEERLHQLWDAELRLALQENEILLKRQHLNIVPLHKILEGLCF